MKNLLSFFISKKIITRGDDVPYLKRWSVHLFGRRKNGYSFFSKWIGLKIHHILVSDDMCEHDHPWSFLSIIIKGGYWEFVPAKNSKGELSLNVSDIFHVPEFSRLNYNKAGYWEIGTWYPPGTILYRKATHLHRLELPNGETCHTIVITFNVKRSWGFKTKNGWLHWSNYSDNSCN